MTGNIFLYISGMRIFGNAEPPGEPIDVSIYLNDRIVHQGEIEPPVPHGEERLHRIFVPRYDSVELPECGSITLKLRSDRLGDEVVQQIDLHGSLWLHVTYEVYSDDHPQKHNQGLKVEIYDRPQKFR